MGRNLPVLVISDPEDTVLQSVQYEQNFQESEFCLTKISE